VALKFDMASDGKKRLKTGAHWPPPRAWPGAPAPQVKAVSPKRTLTLCQIAAAAHRGFADQPFSASSLPMDPIQLPAPRSWTSASARGLAKCCPACGKGALFDGFLTVKPACTACGTGAAPSARRRCPPYLTIFVVGHIMVPLMLVVEKLWHPELWIHFALWVPLTLLLSLWLLPRIKGAVIGLQWAFRMHGFVRHRNKWRNPRASPPHLDFPRQFRSMPAQIPHSE
jgi:uncharacterized protein (DUF983 family)